jgi:hypothetical protein
MNKILLVLAAITIQFSATAQNPIEIGKAQNGTYIITADTSILRKAVEQTLADATKISSMHIESVNKWHYLIATGLQKNYTKTIAIELVYDINTRTYFAKDGLAHKTCASAGCSNCEPFKENGNIIGCHCKEAGTVSNECNFKTETKSAFYYQLTRYLKMKK